MSVEGWVLTIPEHVNDVTRILNVVAAEVDGPIIIDNSIAPGSITVTGTCKVPNFLRVAGLQLHAGIPKPGETTEALNAVWLYEGAAENVT